jgi:hypothetical protein
VIRLQRLVDLSGTSVASDLVPLVKAFHRKSRIPYSFRQTLDQLQAIPLNPAHEFVVATDRGVAVGYLWAEVLANRDYWIHQVYAPGGGVSKVFLAYAEREATRLGCTRLAGFWYRSLEEAKIYCERFGLTIAAVMVERPLDGRRA